MVRWGLVLALGGCAQLAGIDNTSKGVDANVPMSRLQLEHVSIGTTIARSPHDASTVNASFLVPDPAAPGGLRKVVATLEGTDTLAADVGGATVPVLYESPELPNPILRILDFPVATMKAIVPILEHPTPEPAPAGATITPNVTLNTAQAGQTYQLFTIGAWASVALTAPADTATQLAPGPVTLAVANSPIRRLDKLTIDDVVMVLRYTGNQLVASLVATPFDQVMNNNIGGTMVATPLNQTLDLRVNQMAATQRLSTVRPAVGAPSFVWRLRASPGLDFAIDNGPQLHAASVAAPIAADPQTVTAMYGNPFAANFKTLLTWDIRANRTYTGGTMLTATLAAGMTQRAEPSAALALTAPAGLPDRITANGIVLNVDNASVTASMDAPVEVSFVTDAPSNTLYNVELFELVPGAMTYTLTRVVIASAATPNVKIPRDLFKPATLYVLRAFSYAGCYTSVATGDLSQQALPCAFSFADSGVFQVTP